jgi:hypothetical protein
VWVVPALPSVQRIAVDDMDPLRSFSPVFMVLTNQVEPCRQLKMECEITFTPSN